VAKAKKAKERKTAKKKTTRTTTRRKVASRSAPRRFVRRGSGFGLTSATGRVPPPQTAVPKADVGTTVQRFIDWDGVKDLTVAEESGGATFTVTPTA
jgi:hypothetical protein